MSWEDQGRQYHMWFGHGTAAENGSDAVDDPSVVGKTIDERIVALAYGAMAALPASLRKRIEQQYQLGTLPRLKEAMTAWIRGTRLDPTTFAHLLFDREPSDPVVRDLYAASAGAAYASSHERMREAAGKLADGIKQVGIDQWPRFIADASENVMRDLQNALDGK